MEECYLCGEPIADGDLSRDHVPPRQFFLPPIRKDDSSQLATLRAHRACNAAYQRDEEYLFHSLAPLALQSPLASDINAVLRRGLSRTTGSGAPPMIYKRVLSQFEPRPAGLVIPGRVAYQLDGTRAARVIWKVVRGLFVLDSGKFLPAKPEPQTIRLATPWEPHGPELFLLAQQPSRGHTPSVFDYRRLALNFDDEGITGWGYILFFWGTIAAAVLFHDPTCECGCQSVPSAVEPVARLS